MLLHRNVWYRFSVLLLALAFAISGSAAASAKDKNKKKSDEAQQQTSSKVDLNTASEKELDALPGIGSATSKKIIDNRPYSSVDDLKKAGVKQAEIEKIRSMVMVSAPETSASKTESAGSKSEESKTSSKSNESSSGSQSKSALPQSDNAAPAPPSGSGMVWVNLDSGVYHREGDRWYGKTKHGKYMSETDAQKAGYRAAKNGKD